MDGTNIPAFSGGRKDTGAVSAKNDLRKENSTIQQFGGKPNTFCAET
jgi:hypothetical protein